MTTETATARDSDDAAAVIKQEAADNRRRNRAEAASGAEGVSLDFEPVPSGSDRAGLLRWINAALPVAESAPIIDGVRGGSSGPSGHAELRRRGAPPIRFEPVSVLTTPIKLITCLQWELHHDDDGEVPAYKGPHCRQIGTAVRRLCTNTHVITAEQETAGIVDAFLQTAERCRDGLTTYGNSQQRFEACNALSPLDADGRPPAYRVWRYLVDHHSGELVIPVNDLQTSSRITTGTSHQHGWLDGRMETALGWERIRLEGYALPGRAGRKQPGAHRRLFAYRGVLPTDVEVTT